MIDRVSSDLVMPGEQMVTALRAQDDSHQRVRIADSARVTDYEIKRAARGWTISRLTWSRIARALGTDKVTQ